MDSLSCRICNTKDKTLKICAKCRCVYYCSIECQKQHWQQTHKSECSKLVERCKEFEALRLTPQIAQQIGEQQMTQREIATRETVLEKVDVNMQQYEQIDSESVDNDEKKFEWALYCLYRAQNVEKGLSLLQSLVDSPSVAADANLELGRAYLYGLHDRQVDFSRALKYMEAAAAKGSAAALYSAGLLYLTGTGVPMQPLVGIELLKRGAAQGYPRAMARIAKLHLTGGFPGTGVMPDPVRAVELLSRAADEFDDIEAMSELVDVYQYGEYHPEVPKNVEKAIQYAHRAALLGVHHGWLRVLRLMTPELSQTLTQQILSDLQDAVIKQRSPEAAYVLGLLYEFAVLIVGQKNLRIVPLDKPRAYKHYDLAEKLAGPFAKQLLQPYEVLRSTLADQAPQKACSHEITLVFAFLL